MKKLTANSIGVDAGMIIVADVSYLDQFEDRGNPDLEGEVFEVPNGIFNVKWSIPNTWNGSIKGEKEIRVTSGKIFICDPCYVIGHSEQENWMQWLDDTDYGRAMKADNAFIIDDMGGDGCYQVELKLS